MTIDEAIRILEDILRYVKEEDPPKEHIAIQIGIEALKRVKGNRMYPSYWLLKSYNKEEEWLTSLLSFKEKMARIGLK